jgi:hypothetical protein
MQELRNFSWTSAGSVTILRLQPGRRQAATSAMRPPNIPQAKLPRQKDDRSNKGMAS